MWFKRSIGALISISLLVIGTRRMPSQDNRTHETDAAAIALLELRTSVGTSLVSNSTQWLLVPQGRTVSTAGLVAFLAESPKPLQCRATIQSSGAKVELACGRASDSLARYIKMSADFVLQRLERAWGNFDPAATDVLVIGNDESLVVSYHAFAEWLRSYSVDLIMVEYIHDPPPDEAIRSGSRMMVKITRRATPPE